MFYRVLHFTSIVIKVNFNEVKVRNKKEINHKHVIFCLERQVFPRFRNHIFNGLLMVC